MFKFNLFNCKSNKTIDKYKIISLFMDNDIKANFSLLLWFHPFQNELSNSNTKYLAYLN